MSLPLDERLPVVTVVMTLMFNHGRAVEAITGWTLKQTLPRQRIELIVVSDGADAALESHVAELLGPADRLLRIPSDNEMHLYDLGARSAHAPWLLFTESHVIPAEDCLARLLDYVARTGFDGACVRTLPGRQKHWVSEVEERMYLEDAAIWTQPHDWRKFTKRGVIIRRSAYEAVGGLDHVFRRFPNSP